MGDFVSFLYGAKAHNLYKVTEREAIRDAEELPPWPPITSASGKKKYYFPFRLALKPVRQFTESLVRHEFAYVAENLLLRGGYRKTHFQADQTTLQSASQMGTIATATIERLTLPRYETFVPSFSRKRTAVRIPEVLPLTELTLQTAIRRHLSHEANRASFLRMIGAQQNLAPNMEPLGEKALFRGHIDILLKERIPLGSALRIPIEVKLETAQPKDVTQLAGYVEELGPECPTGVLVAARFAKKAVRDASGHRVRLVRYLLDVDLSVPVTFEGIWQPLSLEALS